MKEIHIGNMIRDRLKAEGRSMTWFAKLIHCDRSNAYKMLKKPSMDVALLMFISEQLRYNFLKDCSDKLDLDNQKANKTADSDKKTW